MRVLFTLPLTFILVLCSIHITKLRYLLLLANGNSDTRVDARSSKHFSIRSNRQMFRHRKTCLTPKIPDSVVYGRKYDGDDGVQHRH